MTNNNRILQLEEQLEAISSTLNRLDSEIKSLDTEMKRLHEVIVKKSNFSQLQLTWEECKWNKWISVQQREKKLQEAFKLSNDLEKLQNNIH